MLHKVEFRPEIIKEARHIIRLQAANLNEDVLLNTQILMITLKKVSGELVRLRNILIDLNLSVEDRSSGQKCYKAIEDLNNITK